MKLRILAFVAVVAVSGIGSANAVTSDGTYVVWGVGVDSCGKYTAAVNKGQNQDNWIDWNKYSYFTTGYITALNATTPETYNLLGSTDLEGAMAFIAIHCKENPLDKFVDGLKLLVDELHPQRSKEY